MTSKLYAGMLVGANTLEEIVDTATTIQSVSSDVDGIVAVLTNPDMMYPFKKLAESFNMPVRMVLNGNPIHPDTNQFNYGLGRNLLLAMINPDDYILMIDTDEYLSYVAGLSIRSIIDGNTDMYVMNIKSQHMFPDGKVRTVTGLGSRIVKGRGRYKFSVHERYVASNMTVKQIPKIELFHTGYDTTIETIQRKAKLRYDALQYELSKTQDTQDIKYLTEHLENCKIFLDSNTVEN